MVSDKSLRWAIGAVLGFVSVLGLAQFIGIKGRVHSATPQVHTVRTAADAYETLRADGVKGRVLVVLDERTRVVPRTWMATFMDSLTDQGVEPPVMKHNLTSSLVYAGIAREVYFVPPDGLWDTELARISNRPDSLAEGNGARARFYGVPVHVTRSADVPVFGEKVVVYIAESVASRYDPKFIESIIDTRVADVVIKQVAE